jgi:hypothetical protein
MGKLKDSIIIDSENMPDLSMDDMIREDIFFRYGVDLVIAKRVISLMRLSSPPETLYVHNPELYDIWLEEFLIDDGFNTQLNLFDDVEGDALWAWEK